MPPKRTAAMKGSTSLQSTAVKRPAPSDMETVCEYEQRRQRNNIAVKKSREKSRARAQMTTAKVEQLRLENSELEGKVSILTKELELLKDLLVLRAGKACETDSGENAVVSESSTTGVSSSIAANPSHVQQDHGYVSVINRPHKPR